MSLRWDAIGRVGFYMSRVPTVLSEEPRVKDGSWRRARGLALQTECTFLILFYISTLMHME